MKSITQKTLSVLIIGGSALAILAVLIISITASADGTQTVTGNTSGGENQVGWLFNRVADTSTAYEFVLGLAPLGMGSLKAGPITNTAYSGGTNPNNDMFVAEYFPATLPVSSFTSFSYDFMIGEGGDAADAEQFYLSVFANVDNSTNSYDCRYDYKPVSGTVGSFKKTGINAESTPARVVRGTDRIADCPPILAGMPGSSHIRAFSINMGDTSADDTGLIGYFDNVELVSTGDATVFNFEPMAKTKEDCAGDGWKNYRFKNQGQCMKTIS